MPMYVQCMQGTHNRLQQRRDFGAMPARIRNNRRTLVKKPTNRENIYNDRLVFIGFKLVVL